ncbi:MAG: hypothetical protein M1828_000587 [Chrysothrix sp. TS-e1954]|nr:MAG: hypothetical protein M1828_000587 [Chrysothrix sp. TS-e1954]
MEYISTLQSSIDDLKPSLFELLSESQLSRLLAPTLRYLLAITTPSHPRLLLPLLNTFDEAYSVLSLLLERYYLRNYGGSFTEHFYGLKRARTPATSFTNLPRTQLAAPEELRQTLRLRRSDVWRNLAVLVGVPYIRRKLEEGYDIHVAPLNAAAQLGAGGGWGHGSNPQATTQIPEEEGTIGKVRRKAWNWYRFIFLKRIFPLLNAVHHLAVLAFNLAYLFDASRYHDPFLYLIGTRMRRMGQADYRAIAAAEDAAAKARTTARGGNRPGGTSFFHPRVLAGSVAGGLAGGMRYALPASVFALKFLEWWHASDFARQLSRKAAENLSLPPPIISALTSPSADPRPAATTSSMAEKTHPDATTASQAGARKAPISASSRLRILTVPPQSSSSGSQSSDACPICGGPIQTATASPYGFVYCYGCIHRWVDGTTEVQTRFMAGEGVEPGEVGKDGAGEGGSEKGGREGRWESGAGRDAVTGRRVIAGTEGLRRVVA